MAVEQLRDVREGWSVVGSDGDEVGKIVAVAEDHLVVEHGLINKQTLYVPVDAVAKVGDEAVELDMPAGEARQMGWQVPPGTPRATDTRTTGPRLRRAGRGDMTTMTGAGFGAGGTSSAAGPLDPSRGDSIHDRLGGSSRAGLGRPVPSDADKEDDAVATDTTSAGRRDDGKRG